MAVTRVTPFRQSHLKRFLFTLLRLTLTLIITLFLPLIFVIFGAISLYRLLIFKLAKRFDPKLGKMVSAISNWFAGDTIYENSYTVNVALHVVGRIDRHHLVTKLNEFLKSNTTPDGQLLYPELTQRIVQKFGYTFWENVDNFRVDDHVSYLNPSNPDEPVTLSDLHDVMGKLGKMPMDKSKSPWEIIIIKNFVDWRNPAVKSAILTRLHHCMFDGYSVLNILSKLCDNGPLVLAGHEKMAELQRSGGSFLVKYVVKPLLVLLAGPYELIGQMMRYDDNQIIRTSRREFNSVMRFQEVEPINIEELKQIKKHFQVTLSTLHTSLVAGGLRTYLEKRNINLDKINITFPLPVKNHPDKLRNYFTGGIIKIGMRFESRSLLLQNVQRKFDEFRFAYAVGLPEASMLLLRILGSLPTFLMPKIDNVPLSCTMMHSSFPGPIEIGMFCGFPVVDATVGGSISKPYPISTLCFSYNGRFKIAFLADTCTLRTKEDAEEIADAVYQEFEALAREAKEDLV